MSRMMVTWCNDWKNQRKSNNDHIAFREAQSQFGHPSTELEPILEGDTSSETFSSHVEVEDAGSQICVTTPTTSTPGMMSNIADSMASFPLNPTAAEISNPRGQVEAPQEEKVAAIPLSPTAMVQQEA